MPTRRVIVNARRFCVERNSYVGGRQRIKARRESLFDVRPVERNEHDDDGRVDGLQFNARGVVNQRQVQVRRVEQGA